MRPLILASLLLAVPSLGAAGTLTVVCDEDAEFAGSIQGAGGVTKLGRGRLTCRGPVGGW